MDICFTLWVRTYYHRYFFCYTNCPRFDWVALWTRCASSNPGLSGPQVSELLARHLPACSQLFQPALTSGSSRSVPHLPHRMLDTLHKSLPSRTDAWPQAVCCAQCQSAKLTRVDFLLQMGRGVRMLSIEGPRHVRLQGSAGNTCQHHMALDLPMRLSELLSYL